MREIITLIETVQYPLLNSAFFQWFCGSKVIDENGNPLVVHHGGPSGIQAFEKSYIGKVHGVDKEGFFFINDRTDSPFGAATYANKATRDDNGQSTTGGHIYDVFLSIKKPYTLDDYVKLVQKSWPKHKVTVDSLMTYGGDEQHAMSILDDEKDEIINDALNNGCDGIIFGRYDDYVFVVFEPNQIKSIYNRGTWSESDPHIDR